MVTPELHIRLFPLKSLFPPPFPPLRQQKKNTLEYPSPWELFLGGARQTVRVDLPGNTTIISPKAGNTYSRSNHYLWLFDFLKGKDEFVTHAPIYDYLLRNTSHWYKLSRLYLQESLKGKIDTVIISNQCSLVYI